MGTIHTNPCDEARIEEQEFYHLVLNTPLQEEVSCEESIEEFLSEQEKEEQKRRYPIKWRDAFYDPYQKRL